MYFCLHYRKVPVKVLVTEGPERLCPGVPTPETFPEKPTPITLPKFLGEAPPQTTTVPGFKPGFINFDGFFNHDIDW